MELKNILKRIKIVKIAILAALLGAYGGQGQKKYRRVYLPALLTILALLYIQHWLLIFIMSMMGAFAIGYGIPCPSDPDPSSLGNFWYKVFKGNNFWTNFFTRGTIGFLVSLSLIWIPIIKSNWLLYLIGSGIIMLTYALISWRDFGVIKINGGHLLKVDLIVYGMIGLIAGVIIYF